MAEENVTIEDRLDAEILNEFDVLKKTPSENRDEELKILERLMNLRNATTKANTEAYSAEMKVDLDSKRFDLESDKAEKDAKEKEEVKETEKKNAISDWTKFGISEALELAKTVGEAVLIMKLFAWGFEFEKDGAVSSTFFKKVIQSTKLFKV